MIVKRLGPSLVPAEVVVPLENLGGVHGGYRAPDQPADRQRRRHRQEWTRRKTRGGHPRLHPQRPAQVLLQLRLRPRPVHHEDRRETRRPGLFHRPLFLRKVKAILGEERPKRLKAFKKRSTGAVFSTRAKSSSQPGQPGPGLRQLFEPLIRPFGNNVVTQVGERPDKPVRGHPRRCRLVCLRLLAVRLLRR